MQLFGSKIVKKMHIVTCIGEEQHSNSSNTKGTNDIFRIPLELWLNNGFLAKKLLSGALSNFENAFRVTRPRFNRVVPVQRNYLLAT